MGEFRNAKGEFKLQGLGEGPGPAAAAARRESAAARRGSGKRKSIMTGSLAGGPGAKGILKQARAAEARAHAELGSGAGGELHALVAV